MHKPLDLSERPLTEAELLALARRGPIRPEPYTPEKFERAIERELERLRRNRETPR